MIVKTRLFAAALLTVLAASPVFAQEASQVGDQSATAESWVTVLLAMALIIGVVVASFMSSKRGHQD